MGGLGLSQAECQGLVGRVEAASVGESARPLDIDVDKLVYPIAERMRTAMSVVQRWSGRETRALREAMRMTLVEFAEHLGVSDRAVSKWEAGGALKCPMPAMQQVLDVALARSSGDIQARFATAVAIVPDSAAVPVDDECFCVGSHKFVPLYVGVEMARRLSQRPEFSPVCVGWADGWRGDLRVDSGVCTAYVFACGVVVGHVRQELELGSIASLAVWRYRSYHTDLPWFAEELAAMVPECTTVPEYVLSVYVLRSSPWTGDQLDTALRLMCTPSVLVDRTDPSAPVAAPAAVEQAILAAGFTFPDVASFGVPGVSVGYAGWAAISYFPIAPERAVDEGSLVECELLVQMLWCYSRQILRTIEDGHDPETSDEFGWRFLRAARTRLTTARAQETSQHSLMRTAILETSGLPHRLAEALEALRQTHSDVKG